MNFNELSLARESTRSYKDQEVTRDALEEIMDEVLRSPSACNSQPWKFVICDGETAKKLPEHICSEDLPINQWTPKVPAFIVVCETKAKLMSALNLPSQTFAQIDIGIVSAGICYSAADKGIGSCIIGCFDEAAIKELLCIPEDVTIRLIISLGYSKKEVRQKFRKEKDDIRSYNVW